MDAHEERKQVKVRKENSNEPGRVAFWWLRRTLPQDDEVWERLRNSNVDMESAGARMLWITRSISCENGEKFAGREARGKKKVSPFDSPVPTFLHPRNALRSLLRLLSWQDWFYEFVMFSIQDEWSFDRRVTYSKRYRLLYIWICSCAILIEISVRYSYEWFRYL